MSPSTRKALLSLGVSAFALTAFDASAGESAESRLLRSIDSALGQAHQSVLEERTAGPRLLQIAAGDEDEEGEGGEGGEAGEGAGVLESYSLGSTDPNAFSYEAAAQIETYADLAYALYSKSHREALTLQEAIAAFLAAPSEESLQAARYAWLNARPAYLQTEVLRFYDGPIDVDPASGDDGPEGRINAWPLNEAFIDYVAGAPNSGLVNDASTPISAETILERDQVTDEADVTTGWHAIEFLLWGQDQSAEGPGARPYSDYLPGQANSDRRRQYLQIVTALLVDDLAGLAAQWAPDQADNYRARFLALDRREAIGRVMNGMAQLAGYELASERLAVALDSGDQEDEQSCFSDNTNADFIYDLRGIANVYFGAYGATSGPGIDTLVAEVDPELDQKIQAALVRATTALDDIDRPFDRVLASEPGSAARMEAEEAVTALQDLAALLKEAGNKLGVLVIVAGL
jgi:putative iron-regulated protein